MTQKIDTTKYTDQTLVIPADICKILERENLLAIPADDFSLSFEIENGKVKITDMLEYTVKDFPSLEPEEAWDLVRKWWVKAGKHIEADKVIMLHQKAINIKEEQIQELQTEIVEIENTKKKWRLW
jgi:hypothetical protein